MDDKQLLEFIDHIEEKEIKLLTWGMVDYRFSEKEIQEEFINFFGTNPHVAFNEFKDELVKKHFLFQFSRDNYRSRTAEIVRLISRLKQLFREHKDNDSWPAGKDLVGDFRFIKRKRQRPDRNQVGVDQLMEDLSELHLTPLQKKVLNAIVGQRSLAGFQSRAIKAILSISGSENRDSDGVLISAGTGSGKTLAFYIPVILSIVRTLEKNTTLHTKCIAIYPRTELLKDQLVETLKVLHNFVNPVLAQHGIRPIRMGAFFGQTPRSNNPNDLTKFTEHKNGKIIPFLNCPEADCTGNLYWNNTKNLHIVKCTKCEFTSRENEVELTRDKIVSEPPDILFTTTEMLNRHLSNYSVNKIWGISQQDKPGFVLFDEVHTYNGNHGAGVSYLLRRYLRNLGFQPVVAGLSATLKEGKRFFARFTNLDEARVIEVTPERSELVRFGAEYKMVLRNDPTVRAQLLSTTLQLLMLLRRVIDKRGHSHYFGDKVFAFTDDLDATNRLFFDLYSAEAGNLSQLRAIWQNENPEHLQRRFEAGQYWKLSQELGFNLSHKLILDRTTSQDSGVKQQVDVVVATASLEVGYNDSGVGVVVQHKTPRTAAQLIQREGRAGRTDIMRPWTVVTLSDFGMDRATFQAYEQLFDPELEPNNLPLNNLHIIKIQAVYAFIEWLGQRLSMQNLRFNMWDVLKYRATMNDADAITQKKEVIKKIEQVLNDEFVLADFKNYLVKTLSLNDYLLDKILWAPPRSLMLEALPTLLRRLETNWRWERERVYADAKQKRRDNGEKVVIDTKLLPEFLPSTLFTDLNLPELEINLGGTEENPVMSYFQGINEYAPGNVSARYTINRRREKHWIPVDFRINESEGVFDVDTFIDMRDIINYGEKTIRVGDEEKKYLFIRPKFVNVKEPPIEIKDYSKSYLEWCSTIEHGEGTSFMLHIPQQKRIRFVISAIDVHMHSSMGQLTIDRMATGVNTSTAIRDERIEKHFSFESAQNHGIAIAYGSRMYVDGIKFRFEYPETVCPDNPDLKRHLRRQYFKHKLNTLPDIIRTMNIFEREVLEEFLIFSVVNRVFNHNDNAAGLIVALQDVNVRNGLISEFCNYFGDPGIEGGFDPEEQAASNEEQLLHFFAREESIGIVEELLSHLSKDVDDEEWLRNVYKTTLGTLVLESFKRLIGDVLDTDLILDITDGLNRDIQINEDCFYISESAPGSTGVIEKFIETYNREPGLFFKLLLGTAAPEDEELIDVELNWLLRRNDIPELFADYRAPNADIEVKDNSLKRISETLQMNGRHSTHMIMSSTVNRLLFPGSNPASDSLALRIHKEWGDIETRLGFEVDSRVFADVLASNAKLSHTVSETLGISASEQQLISAAFYRFLWPKGGSVRNRVLSSYNPFNPVLFTDKLVLSGSLNPGELPELDCTVEGHHDIPEELFTDNGGVVLKILVTPGANINAKRILHDLIVNPVEFDVILEYPRINRVEQNDNNYLVELISGIVK